MTMPQGTNRRGPLVAHSLGQVIEPPYSLLVHITCRVQHVKTVPLPVWDNILPVLSPH